MKFALPILAVCSVFLLNGCLYKQSLCAKSPHVDPAGLEGRFENSKDGKKSSIQIRKLGPGKYRLVEASGEDKPVTSDAIVCRVGSGRPRVIAETKTDGLYYVRDIVEIKPKHIVVGVPVFDTEEFERRGLDDRLKPVKEGSKMYYFDNRGVSPALALLLSPNEIRSRDERPISTLIRYLRK